MNIGKFFSAFFPVHSRYTAQFSLLAPRYVKLLNQHNYSKQSRNVPDPA